MGLAWGLIFFALRVASRQNTFDSNIAMPELYTIHTFYTIDNNTLLNQPLGFMMISCTFK